MLRKYKGQSLVEFALILPLLLMVLLTLIDAAFLIQAYLTVNHAAREATRFAIAYQPNATECIDWDGDGIRESGYPYCPAGGAGAPETDTDYQTRRVLLIKKRAVEAAFGLRTSIVCTTNGDIVTHVNDSGMLGVRVWGFQSFETAEVADKPGLPGLPVRVQVVHNVPLVVYGTLLPNAYVTVGGSTDMINEGVQVGIGNVPPPVFAPPPPLVPPVGGPSVTPAIAPSVTTGPTPTPTVIPVYHVTLDFENAVNILPNQRAHPMAAKVTGANNENMAGAQVTFQTNAGSFHYSGTGTQVEMVVSQWQTGNAQTVIYSNRPATATIKAWLDFDNDGVIDPNEPSDTATKIWKAVGPYLVLTNYKPAPLETVALSVMDHLYTENPFSLWLCPASITSSQIITRVAYPINVDSGTLDFEGINYTLPVGVNGTYYIESHTGTGGTDGCAQPATLRAKSDIIEIAQVPPDLVINNITAISGTTVGSGMPITLAIEISNESPVTVTTGPFDLDVYPDQTDPPILGQLGKVKQWLTTIGPAETKTITTVVQFYTLGTHKLWAQIDTSNYIEESGLGETNNLYGPMTFTVTDCLPDEIASDNFNDNSFAAKWTGADIGNPTAGNQNESGSVLTVNANGTDISGTSDKFRYIYQSYTGDFRATVKVQSVPSNNAWAKGGLMARENNAANSPYVYTVQTYSNGVYQLIRPTAGASNSTSAKKSQNATSYMMLQRIGDTFSSYYSANGSSWTLVGTTTSVTMPNTILLGMATTSRVAGALGAAKYDDFKVCRPIEAVAPPTDSIYPPGLVMCSELIIAPGFEGNAAAVFQYWNAGTQGAYQRSAAEFYRGSFSMRLHASLGTVPCAQSVLQPYLYQSVKMPKEVFTKSVLVVTGQYRVQGSLLTCSNPNSPDAGDVLSVQMMDQNGGSTIGTQQTILNGGAVSGTWKMVPITLSTGVDLSPYADKNMRIHWSAFNDGDMNGTFFYLDDLSAQLCTKWDIPADTAGTASIGGLITTRSENNIPTPLPGTDVWAYTQGGTVYHTRSIHDGTYHFYNIPPGSYVIYAEAWVAGQLRTVTAEVTITANQRDYGINLLLQ